MTDTPAQTRTELDDAGHLGGAVLGRYRKAIELERERLRAGWRVVALVLRHDHPVAVLGEQEYRAHRVPECV